MSYAEVESRRAFTITSWPWERLRARCLRETSRILTRPEDAEEAAQEALTRAWRCRHQCSEASRPEPWIAQIARREAFRLLARGRDEGRRVLVAGEQIHLEQDSCGEHELTVDRLTLGQELDRLCSEDRALLLLVYKGDIAKARLARAMGIPEATVRVRLHRLRAQLKESMADDMVTERTTNQT
jgi:RNA polymerase sigma-70 factor (ECF subfamily)